MTETMGPSRWIDLADGRRLHARQLGTGAPTVVFEAGMACSLPGWGAVVPGVAERTRAVAYDRAGYGRSDADAERRTVTRMAADLVELLHHLGDDRYVLVAHSWGGPIIRQVAADRPDLVAGLVLVDPSDEGMPLFDSPAAARQRRFMVKALPWLARAKLLRPGVRAATKGLPDEFVQELLRTDTTRVHALTFQAELDAFGSELARLQRDPLDQPDIPVTIITGTKPTKKTLTGTGDEARQAVLDANLRRAESFPQGRHVAATDSTHYVPFTQPELVVAEVIALVDGLEALHRPEIP